MSEEQGIGQETPVSLEAINQRLKAIVEEQTLDKPICVRGVAAEVNRTRSGHVHLRLRQEGHGLGCVVFQSVARELPFRIEDGQTLLVQGEVKVDERWGELQIVARRVELDGPVIDEGGLEALKARAREAGWLDPARKRPLPRPPQGIGLIAGQQSKARADVVGGLNDAGVKAPVVLQAVTMQGPTVAQDVKAALGALDAKGEVDVIVIARGGGSKAELAAFSDWALAQAIVESRAPVVTAIGHREDESLADLVAELSVPTPSLVGAALVGSRETRGREWALVAALAVLATLLLVLARAMGWW